MTSALDMCWCGQDARFAHSHAGAPQSSTLTPVPNTFTPIAPSTPTSTFWPTWERVTP